MLNIFPIQALQRYTISISFSGLIYKYKANFHETKYLYNTIPSQKCYFSSVWLIIYNATIQNTCSPKDNGQSLPPSENTGSDYVSLFDNVNDWIHMNFDNSKRKI